MAEKMEKEMVGANGFEPSTSWSRTRRASQAALRPDRHDPPLVTGERVLKLNTANTRHLEQSIRQIPTSKGNLIVHVNAAANECGYRASEPVRTGVGEGTAVD